MHIHVVYTKFGTHSISDFYDFVAFWVIAKLTENASQYSSMYSQYSCWFP